MADDDGAGRGKASCVVQVLAFFRADGGGWSFDVLLSLLPLLSLLFLLLFLLLMLVVGAVVIAAVVVVVEGAAEREELDLFVFRVFAAGVVVSTGSDERAAE